MKAVNYSGPFKVTVQDVEKPGIEHPDDVIVKVTTSGERNEEMQPAELPGHSESEVLIFLYSNLRVRLAYVRRSYRGSARDHFRVCHCYIF